MNESISLTECATCGEIEERAICVGARKDGMCVCWGAHENSLSRKQTLKVLKLVLVLLQSKTVRNSLLGGERLCQTGTLP